jgi:DNA-binding winged helix-turn-helix (wHTH) protein
VVTREEILDALWGVDYMAESNVVDRQIGNLRTRLQDDWRQPRFIATVPGRGYRFLLPSTDIAAVAVCSSLVIVRVIAHENASLGEGALTECARQSMLESKLGDAPAHCQQ